MAYTPPAYNVVNADLKPAGKPSPTIPAYNVVNADLNVEDGGGGGISQTVVLNGFTDNEFGTPNFFLVNHYLEVPSIQSEESFGYPKFEMGQWDIRPYSIPSTEAFGYPNIYLKRQTVAPYSIESGESFGYPYVVNQQQFIFPNGIDDGAIGVPTILNLQQFVEPSSIDDGEIGSPEFVLRQTVNFDIDFYDGSELSSELQEFVTANFEIALEIGETIDITVNAGSSSFGEILYHHTGESLEAELSDNPVAEFPFTVYVGEELYAEDVSIAPNLGDIEIFSGESVDVEEIDTAPNIYMWEGASLSLVLQTTDTFDSTFFAGESVEIEIDVRPSEGIGEVSIYHGSWAELRALATLAAIPLSVTFYHSNIVEAGIGANTWFDLDVSCCTNHNPGQQDFHHIEMNDAEFPDQKFDGDRIRMVVDLQTQPRFQIQMHDGARMVTREQYTESFLFRAQNGETSTVNLESNVNFRLCPGNFVPDGDNVFVELDFTDDEDCAGHHFFHGQTMKTGTISTRAGFQAKAYTGESVSFDIVMSEAWAVEFGHGESFVWKRPEEFKFDVFTGETSSAQFHEPPINAYTGETMVCDVQIKYDVKFTEDGCLDNEYIHVDENGDPIPELFNPVPVEMDRYQHDIKAICF